MKIIVIQGPNINMLGIREQNIYGAMTMEQIHEQLSNTAKENNIELDFFQSNLEGEIVDKIQESLGEADAILINPAAYSHTSIAIKDAIAAVGLPTVEVHISNIYAREEFRKHSVTASVCAGVLSGFGPFGYHLGLIYLIQVLNETKALQSQNEQSE